MPRPKPGKSYHVNMPKTYLNAFINLASLIARNETRLEEADLLFRQVINMRSDYTKAYSSRGEVLLQFNRTKEAQENYERALFYDSNNADLYYNVSISRLLLRNREMVYN